MVQVLLDMCGPFGRVRNTEHSEANFHSRASVEKLQTQPKVVFMDPCFWITAGATVTHYIRLSRFNLQQMFRGKHC